MFRFIMLCILVNFSGITADDCFPRKYHEDSIVCVCNINHCDTISKVQKLPKMHYKKYTSSRSGLRFREDSGKFGDINSKIEDSIEIDQNIIYQTISGFGGSFTDSAGFNILSLGQNLTDILLKSYYSEDGIEYSMGRVPMGATDFSTHPYTYDDVKTEDMTLKYFKLHEEDFKLKIPLITRALELSNNKLNLVASPWTAPPWMKTNHKYNLIGLLKNKYYQIYAEYYIKFFDAYAENNIPFWGLTTGNEPFDGFLPFALPTTGWTPQKLGRWIAKNLGPTIRNSIYNKTKIIIHDDQRLFLPAVQKLFENEEALKYVDGVAVHWYLDFITPTNFLNFAKTPKKDVFLLASEATTGFLSFIPVALGSWKRAEKYISSVMTNLEYDAIGWIDFNLALDVNGGPVYTHFTADAAIIVNATGDEFYKQPMYYAMGHFSKFLPSGTTRIKSASNKDRQTSNIVFLAFKRPDQGIVLIIFNKSTSDSPINIKDASRGEFSVVIESKSIVTILYW